MEPRYIDLGSEAEEGVVVVPEQPEVTAPFPGGQIELSCHGLKVLTRGPRGQPRRLALALERLRPFTTDFGRRWGALRGREGAGSRGPVPLPSRLRQVRDLSETSLGRSFGPVKG